MRDHGAHGAHGALRAALGGLVGHREPMPCGFVQRWPQLALARVRRGGLPPRVAGWCLGQRSVAAVTLWRTIWVASDAPLTPRLLLHELRHLQQFQGAVTFPCEYLWETLRRGYHNNRFEADARVYADECLRAPAPALRRGDV